MLAVPSNSPAQRSIHTSTRLRAGAGAGATDGGAKQSKQDTKAEEEEFADEQIDVNEPMVAKISRCAYLDTCSGPVNASAVSVNLIFSVRYFYCFLPRTPILHAGVRELQIDSNKALD